MMSRVALVMAVTTALAACGASLGPRVSSPFTAGDAEVFDDAFDRLATPTDLPEGFRERWQRRLCKRAARSDVVAVVTVPNIRVDTNPDRVSRLRIIAHVERQLFGDGIDELVLPVREGEVGWDTVSGREDELLGGTFVAYVKWVHRDDDEEPGLSARASSEDAEAEDERPVEAHWHLSPASEQVVGATERALVAREDD
jgi:hypothetical protein